ncbi:MAG TPA: DUF4844 domain-containing protein, partial [Alphaproteobacteria bacterium]|nr:DUF4844 domain-containing protein [Alphaproteobacteria bacterium]
KFVSEPGTSFNGLRPEEVRATAETQLNDLIERLMNGLPAGATTNVILHEFRRTLRLFPSHETEDRERMCGYLEQIMEILGIESSHGLLNRWLYGPVLGTLVSLRRRS